MKRPEERSDMHRRTFLKLTGTAGAGLALGMVWVGDGIAAIPASQGYLLVNTRRCAACMNCMLVCSLAHEGRADLTVARIKVISDSFLHFPDDVSIDQCRQCAEPACVDACQTGALHIDDEHGNVRVIDKEKCVGCRLCMEACPHTPSRVAWDPEAERAVKCDLCLDTPHWKQEGGPGGKQACIEVCPFNCITFTDTLPTQEGASGYKIGEAF
jgi:protein NrfC